MNTPGWRSVPASFRLLPFAFGLLPLLSACQDQTARQQNAALTRRVEALEAEVGALRGQSSSPADASGVTTRAAAQNCALQLSRQLEEYRRGSLSGEYPPRAGLRLPAACEGWQVRWNKLSAQAYSFAVLGGDGAELATGAGPRECVYKD